MAVDDFSDTAINAFRSQHSREIAIDLMEISVPGSRTYRFANNGKDVTSNNVKFDAFPFLLPDPNENDEEPETGLQFPALTRDAAKAIRSTPEEIRVRWWQVLKSDPDTILQRFPAYVARDVEVGDLLVSGTLRQKEYGQETYPPRFVDQVRFPGLWRAQ